MQQLALLLHCSTWTDRTVTAVAPARLDASPQINAVRSPWPARSFRWLVVDVGIPIDDMDDAPKLVGRTCRLPDPYIEVESTACSSRIRHVGLRRTRSSASHSRATMRVHAPALAVCALFIGHAAAFWRLPCRNSLTIGRLDPIISPGSVSSHVHVRFRADARWTQHR